MKTNIGLFIRKDIPYYYFQGKHGHQILNRLHHQRMIKNNYIDWWLISNDRKLLSVCSVSRAIVRLLFYPSHRLYFLPFCER